MRALAEYIMRGSRQATLVVALGAAIPMMFWVGAAALALVVLRRGLNDALSVMFWGTLPALVWAALGDLTPLAVILSGAGLAALLRQGNLWTPVLLAAVPLGLFWALALLMFFEMQLQGLADAIAQVFGSMQAPQGAGEVAVVEPMSVQALAGRMAAAQMLMALASLMVARSWQARLYNPGGFRQEFHQIRLPFWAAAGLLLLILAGSGIEALSMIAPTANVSLVIAGLALVHGLVGLRELGSFWLVLLYLVLVLMAPLIMVLAFVDSLFDFRSRVKPVSGSSGDDDSNSTG